MWGNRGIGFTAFALTFFILLCAWQDHGTDPPRSYAKAHGGQVGNLRQPAWLHQGQVLPDQAYGFL